MKVFFWRSVMFAGGEGGWVGFFLLLFRLVSKQASARHIPKCISCLLPLPANKIRIFLSSREKKPKNEGSNPCFLTCLLRRSFDVFKYSLLVNGRMGHFSLQGVPA